MFDKGALTAQSQGREKFWELFFQNHTFKFKPKVTEETGRSSQKKLKRRKKSSSFDQKPFDRHNVLLKPQTFGQKIKMPIGQVVLDQKTSST